MSILIETELKDIFTKFDQRFDRLEQRLDRIESDLTTVKLGQAELKGDIKALDEKVSGVNKRLENLEFIIRSVIGGVIVAAVVSFAKYFELIPPLK